MAQQSMLTENQLLQTKLDEAKKDLFAKTRLNQLNEDKLTSQTAQIKKLFEEIGHLNDKIRKTKEENIKISNKNRMTESLIVGHEEENRLLKCKEKSLYEDAFREVEALRAEVKGLKGRRNELEDEKGKKDSEIHTLKIELEKLRMENMELKMGRKVIEAQFGATKESFGGMEPVMMRNEVLLGHKESKDPKMVGKKTCINDLVQMVRNYKADSSAMRRTGHI